jgi:hypothetical protein
MRDANQPGVLEAQRKQAAMTILATMFDSLRRFRKNVGRVRLHFIQDFLADGRMIRVVGEDGMQAVPLLKDQTLGRFEVIIDDSPTSPNQKQETWQFLMQLMPMFKDMMTPEVALSMLEYSPLPSKMVEQFKQMAQKAGEDPQAQKQRQIAEDKELAVIDKDKASAAASRAKGALDLANAAVKANEAALGRIQANILEGTPQGGPEYVVEPEPIQQNQLGGPPQVPQMPNGVAQ